MTDEEIIKALKEWSERGFTFCNVGMPEFSRSILSLIDRQKADIEMLNGLVDELEELCETKTALLTDTNWSLTTVRAKTLKEFADRFKRSCGRVKTEGKSMLVCQESSFDYLVKQMLE